MAAFFNLRQNRINDPEVLDVGLIDRDLKEGKHVIVQFSKASYNDRLLSQLNDLSKRYDREFGIRFYGHYGEVLECNVLRRIPDVKCLYIETSREKY